MAAIPSDLRALLKTGLNRSLVSLLIKVATAGLTYAMYVVLSRTMGATDAGEFLGERRGLLGGEGDGGGPEAPQLGVQRRRIHRPGGELMVRPDLGLVEVGQAEQFEVAKYAVEWRAQFMAHGGQEQRFRFTGVVGVLFRFGQGGVVGVVLATGPDSGVGAGVAAGCGLVSRNLPSAPCT